jgi:glycosyltransferase involved in cell wall biosynthesis
MPDYRIGVITMPIFKAGVTPLSNLISILCSVSKNIFLVTGGEDFDLFRKDTRLKSFRILHKISTNPIKRIVNFISPQLKISFYILKTRKQIDIFIFFFGGDILLLPMLTARLFRKKVILMFASSTIKIHSLNHDPLVFVLKFFHRITCAFSDKIIVYTESLICDYSLQRWSGKIIIAREHYIDFDTFKIKKEYPLRENIVGYVGRFSEEKGILHLLHAVPDIIIKKPEVKFLLIGEGALQNTIEHYIHENNLAGTVMLPGWVPHDLLADYLNQMKLLVIPSDTEGLPNVMLEAMACGTPVLSTPVGSIPSIITQAKTGFILKNNTSQCITSDIIKIIHDESTANVIGNAYQLIRNEFQFMKRVEEFKNIFGDALNNSK